MKKVLFFVGILTLYSSKVTAQEIKVDGKPLLEALASNQIFASVPIPKMEPGMEQKKISDKVFWGFYAGMHVSMLLDGKSTFDVQKRCPPPKCYEANKFARPFIDRGPVVSYVAGTIIEGGAMWLAYKMKESDNKFLQRVWLIIPVMISQVHLLCFSGNIAIK